MQISRPLSPDSLRHFPQDLLSELTRRFEESNHPDAEACQEEAERRLALKQLRAIPECAPFAEMLSEQGGANRAIREALRKDRRYLETLTSPTAVELLTYNRQMDARLASLDARMVAGGYVRAEAVR